MPACRMWIRSFADMKQPFVISQKGHGIDQRVFSEEVLQQRKEQPRIPYSLVIWTVQVRQDDAAPPLNDLISENVDAKVRGEIF